MLTRLLRAFLARSLGPECAYPRLAGASVAASLADVITKNAPAPLHTAGRLTHRGEFDECHEV